MRTQARLIQPVIRPAVVLVVMVAACCWMLATPEPALATPLNQDVVTTTVTTSASVTETAMTETAVTETAVTETAVTETAATTDTLGSSVTPEAVGLPAPFYFIDGSTNQILRLEQDGFTRRAISHELQPVTAFDVAPDGSRLVYIAGNQLIEVDASGLNRVVKVSGEAYNPADTAAAIARQIDNPVYSPDGSTIAFGLNGVNLIASGLDANAAPQLLLASSPYPEADAPTDDSTPIRFFNPISWSPDGARLLVQFAYYPEAGGLALLDPTSGALTELTTDSSDVPLMGEAGWKPDSTGFYIGSSLLAYGSPGLTYVDAATGSATGILTTTAALDLGEANPIYMVRAPHVTAGNDALWAFVAVQTDLQTLTDYRLDSIDATNRTRTPIGEQVYAPDGDVLWARDDSGALVQSGIRVDANGISGSISWMPSNGGDAVGMVAYGQSPRWGSPDFSAPPPEATEVVALFEQSLDLTAARTNTETQAFPPSVAFPVITPDGNTYWVAQTTGMRSFTPDVPHALGIYTHDGDQWQELSILPLVGTQEGVTAGPDYLDPNAVMPTTLDGQTLWLHVEGGAGAHGGVCEIVRFDGEQLTQELDSFSASPGACAIQDVNNDGAKEVVQDATDDYVFCYACGVKNINFTVQRWDGEQFVPMQLEPLTAAAPAQLNTINDEMLRAVQGGLWKSALDLAAQQSITETDPSGVFGWNQALVRLTGTARRDYAENSDNPYPLLGYVFYGDYPAAVDVMRAVSATAIFTQPSTLISGTVAEGWEMALANVLTTTSSSAIAINPQLAAAYFVRGYGEWLADPAAQAAADDVRRAADLKPDDALFAEAVTILTGEARTPMAPLTDTATLTGSVGVTATTGVTNTAAVTATAATTGTAGASGRLFYSANSEGVDRIYALQFGTQNATLTELLAQGRQPSLQPGGVRLAFQSTANDMLGLGGFDLDTGLRVNFTANLEDSLPRWNPADGQIAFSSTRYGDGRERVYTVWPDGRSEAVDLGEGSDPDWSPDGARLVYQGCDAQGANCGLWTMGQDGSDRRALTDNAGDARPRWSPDGSRVVFMSDQRDGNWDVYSVAIESGQVTRITFNPALDGIPAISPDGAEIVFLSNRGDRWGIWRVSIDSGRAQSIVGDVGALPNWLDESMDWVR